MLEAIFSLRANRQHKDSFDVFKVPVERNVATNAFSNDEFPLAVAYGSADQGTVCEHLNGLDQFVDAIWNVLRAVQFQVFDEAVEIVQ